ncbi:SLBB domain-containing protein [Georgfuchsia toluolica]|nr:SLBB domain-containing protein [Georgfuchsia toluolica]
MEPVPARQLPRIIPRNEPNDFQKFMLEATGKLLPIYGADFFEGADSARPAQGAPVPNDYPLGPGDELLIRGWGSIDIDLRAVVDRNGLISIPKVGTVSVAGVRAADAEEVVHNAISKYFHGFNLNVTLGQLRTITIYVVGQAKRPGTYTVSSLSTLVTALSDTGGPNQIGSLRHVQVLRAGKQIAELDFYAFLAKGDKSNDVKLIDGDVIVIPAAAGYVALAGAVEKPAIYEVRDQSADVQSVLELAGGLPVVADPRRALLERIEPGNSRPRSVEEFALDKEGLKKSLKSGDLLTVLPMRPEFSNAVTLRGTFYDTLRVPYHDGMTVTSLIPNREELVSRASLQRQNHDDMTAADSISNKEVPGSRASLLKQNREAREPKNLTRDIGNLYDEINWDYAVVERLNRSDLSVKLISFDLGKALASPGGSDDVPLQAGDTVTVFSINDVRVPITKRRVFVRVEGEVQKPGVYQVTSGDSLIGVLQKAGGLTGDAFLFGTEFYRESVRTQQQQNLDKFVSRLEQQMLQASQKNLSNLGVTDTAAAQQAQAQVALEATSRNRFLQKLRELKATGRIALNVSPQDKGFAQLPDFRLENGDRLFVPNRPDFVHAFGAVNTESAMLWQPGKTISDYLEQSGVSATADEDGAFVMRASGMVLSNFGRWLSSVKGQQALPGDIIVVPEKVDVETTWNAFVRGTKDISQIFANFGLAAAAVHTLNK